MGLANRINTFAYQLSRIGGAIMIFGFPVSISLSQSGLLLAVTGWILYSISKPPSQQSKMQLFIPAALLFALLCYMIQLFSVIHHASASGNFVAEFLRMIKNEPKDIFLVSAALWIVSYTSEKTRRAEILQWLKWSIYILLITGIISVWSKYRLNKIPWLILNDWQIGPQARYQHHLGTFNIGFPLHFYMPIGLMNTHLTYAGLLMLAFPMLILKALDPLIRHSGSILKIPNRWKVLKNIFIFMIAVLVFILNNGRSAMLGTGIAVLSSFLYFSLVYWKKQTLKLIPLAVLLVIGLALFASFAPRIHPRLAAAVNALFSGQKKHTDHQRNLVWNGSLELYQQNPVFGVGPGNYENAIKKHIITYSKKHPHLWTYYALAQRGHAHNDYLHLLTIAGPLALLFYLAFFTILVFIIFSRLPDSIEHWKFGPLGLFAAGFMQCYFQDDEILLPFWIYTGLILGAWINQKKSVQNAS